MTPRDRIAPLLDQARALVRMPPAPPAGTGRPMSIFATSFVAEKIDMALYGEGDAMNLAKADSAEGSNG
jgi:hypothetical protein